MGLEVFQSLMIYIPLNYIRKSLHTVHGTAAFNMEVLARQLFVLQELVSIFRHCGSSFKGPV
jgi:hypothetical protein